MSALPPCKGADWDRSIEGRLSLAEAMDLEQAFSREHHLAPWPAYAFQMMSLLHPDRTCVSSGNNRILGLLLGIPHGRGSFILACWVHSSVRRQGLGTILVRRFLDNAWKRGDDRIWLTTSRSSPDVLAFWKRLGFGMIPILGIGSGKGEAIISDLGRPGNDEICLGVAQ